MLTIFLLTFIFDKPLPTLAAIHYTSNENTDTKDTLLMKM